MGTALHSQDCLIFLMEIHISRKTVLYFTRVLEAEHIMAYLPRDIVRLNSHATFGHNFRKNLVMEYGDKESIRH